MRKVLMIAPTSFFSDYGGHIRILEETLALQELDNRICIVTYYKGKDVPALDIRRTAPLPYRTEYEVGSSRHKIAFDVYLALKSLRVALRERPDIIHAHMHEGTLIGWVIARLLRIPLIFDFQGSLTAEMIDHGFLTHGSFWHRAIRRTERFIDHRADMILTSSKQVMKRLHEEFRMPVDRLHPLPDCVDIERFNSGRFTDEQKAAVRTRYNIPADIPLIVYLGLLTDYQGIPHMLKAAAHLRDQGEIFHFLIMGFPSVQHYRQMAQNMGVSDVVTFTGRVPYNEAPRLLSAGDFAITAKMSSTEGSGKMLNYMALGLPVVAYDTPVHREYLGAHGTYVPAGDQIGLADAIQTLIHTPPPERHEIGNQLRQRVTTHFTWPAAAQQIDTIYQTLLTQNKQRTTNSQ